MLHLLLHITRLEMERVTTGIDMTTAPYGSWSSPLTPEKLIESNKFQQLCSDRQSVYLIEGRPKDGGRCTILHVENGSMKEILPGEFSARSRVHEYGGGACAAKNGKVYFVSAEDQNIHLLSGNEVTPIVTDPGIRFADLAIHHSEKWIYAIQEEHTREKVVNTLALIHLDTPNETQVVHSGYDFYAKPRISPDGKRIAFLAWNLPFMPWDEAECLVGAIKEDGTIENVTSIAGGKDSAVNQIAFGPDNTLYYTLDSSGWWDIYTERGLLVAQETDFGYPDWVFGIHRMAFCGDKLVAIGTKQGVDSLYVIDPKTKSVTPVSLPFTSYITLSTANWKVYAVAASPKQTHSLVEIDITRGTCSTLHSFAPEFLNEGCISEPEIISLGEAYGFYYPPQNRSYSKPENEKPPLIVSIHGGPTGHRDNALKLDTQFWTTRGFGFLDVNHRGSTGNGRACRNALRGNWGVIDKEDACSMAEMLASKGVVDGTRMVITGGSAGGFTVLNSLTFSRVFAGGISLYGISDLELLATDTHKFESKMLEQLVGPYPKLKDVYIERSAIHHAQEIKAPLLLLQGLEDKVVPPNQSEAIYSKLLEGGIPVAYILFEGEGHGFRKGPSIVRTHTAMLSFIRRIFGIESEEHTDALRIDNLD